MYRQSWQAHRFVCSPNTNPQHRAVASGQWATLHCGNLRGTCRSLNSQLRCGHRQILTVSGDACPGSSQYIIAMPSCVSSTGLQLASALWRWSRAWGIRRIHERTIMQLRSRQVLRQSPRDPFAQICSKSSGKHMWQQSRSACAHITTSRPSADIAVNADATGEETALPVANLRSPVALEWELYRWQVQSQLHSPH